jgi:O-antigen/teichoic acid export membrane protein
MQPHKKFAFDVGITFFASAVTLPLGFIITVLLARYLGAGDLGLYRMALTIYGIAMFFATIGIPAAMIKYVAEFKEDRTKFNQIVSSGVITSLFLGIGFIALFYFSSGIFAGIFNMPGLSSLLKLLSPVFPFASVGGALLGMLNGLREMKTYAAATIIQSVLMVIITVALIYYGFGVAGVVIGVVLSSVGFCLFLIWTARKYFEITFSEYIPTTKKMLKFGAQIFGANAINMINYQADIILIGFFLTATDVGYYAVAVGLSKFFWIIPQAIQTITYPATSEYWSNNNHSALQTMIDKSIKYSTCILLPIGLGVGFFAKDIITLIFSEGFIYAVLPLQILLVGTIINGAMQRPIGSILYSIELPELNLRIFASAAIANIILNLLLIPYLGIAGAAIATTISFLLITFLILLYTTKKVRVSINYPWFTKIGFVAIMCILIYYFLEKFNYYSVGGAVIIAFLLIIWFYFLSKNDKSYFVDLVKTTKLYFFK